MVEITGDQSEVFAFLGERATHGLPPGARVRRIDTHGAAVFLAGPDVYKVKRAARFPFMDFSTLEKRRSACDNEILVNRDNAPELYLGTVAIRRGPHGLQLDGSVTGGEIVEWAVHMRRFDEEATLDHIAARGELRPDTITKLADIVFAAHQRAPRRGDDAAAMFRLRLVETLDGLAAAPNVFAAAAVAELRQACLAAMTAAESLLTKRAAQGKVRRCHGDLHLRNIVLIKGAPLLFDAIEFDDSFATCDILYDLAFLVMDLWQRGLEHHANLLLNYYLHRCDPEEEEMAGLAAMPLFLALRAAIRARVTGHLLALAGGGQDGLLQEARHFFAAARLFLAPRPVQLVAVGGFSGSGKSTMAQRLAAAIGRPPGAVHARSDSERKKMFGVGEFERLPEDAYRPEVSRAVYERLRHLADTALRAGQSVIVDAVHAKPEERAAIAAVAARHDAPFTGLWLDAPAATLVARVGARGLDVSDADAAVVEAQLQRPLGPLTWTRLDAGAPLDSLARDALRHIADAGAAVPPAASVSGQVSG